ncbi:MAG: hypothetical protein EU529_13610 [Promethearchaeota archaeon]|nr:MAG: hypothetical protein EU529_13610 [Candidatus Lokiarchaeota archaeon]
MTDIRLLDDEHDKEWTRFIFNACDLEYHQLRENKITREILEKNLDQIVNKIFNCNDEYNNVDAILIGFQILGIFILKTGAFLPEIVKNAILFSTTWEYDKMRGWSRLLEEERKENLDNFRKAILNHKVGKIIKISF